MAVAEKKIELRIKVSQDEYSQIKQAARLCGESVGKFARRAVRTRMMESDENPNAETLESFAQAERGECERYDSLASFVEEWNSL